MQKYFDKYIANNPDRLSLFRMMRKYFGFLLAGIPGFIIAFFLNILAVQNLGIQPSIAYAIVLIIQIIINFIFCKIFIFEKSTNISLLVQFMQFLSTIIIFRILDWGLYTYLVQVWKWNFIIVQIMNIILFSFLKFLFSLNIFEKKNNKTA